MAAECEVEKHVFELRKAVEKLGENAIKVGVVDKREWILNNICLVLHYQ